MSTQIPQTNVLTAQQQGAVRSILEKLGNHLTSQQHMVSDSRQVQQGDIFVAYPFDPLSADAKHDGRTYADNAVQQGARAVLWHNADDGRALPQLGIPTGAIINLNRLAGHIASAFYDSPSAKMRMIAVTGTNGKTSCAQWLAQILSKHDLHCGIMGTLGVGFPNAMVETGFTTPQAVEVHRYLNDMHKQGAQAMVMEVSSHALTQGRVNGVAYEVALFTNLSRDHLDYHGDMGSYESAKAQLFAWDTLKAAVINTDDPVGARYAQQAQARGIRVIAYGLNAQPADVRTYVQARHIDQSGAMTRFDVHVDGQTHHVASHLVGEFNVMNTLGVLGVCMALGLDVKVCAADCAQITAAPGRMQRFGGEGKPLAVVDFAHTPDALEKTLTALRPIAQQRGGKLTCVFGCGGDRDAGKRPQMGKIAQSIADVVVVTSDNPRTENPDRIIADILAGMNLNHSIKTQAHRPTAIDEAINTAAAQDVILVAGKGHEPYQDINGVKHPYSDLEQVAHALTQCHVLTNATPPIIKPTLQPAASMTNITQAGQWMRARAVSGEAAFQRVSTDTRAVQAGDLFIALKGERFDAHDFLPQLQAGQVAAVVAEHVPEGFALPYVLVESTHQALQDLAQHWRAQFKLPLVVVTGSNGKTTVKEMLAAIMQVAHDERYIATRGNLNNDIGLPLTLLNLNEAHQAAIIELGMNHPGETAQLAPLAAPNVALINNAQREHQEFMQTVEAVAQEHADVIDSIQEGGAVVFPADDEYAAIWRERAQARGIAIHDFSIDEATPALYSARYELGLYASTVQLITPMGQCTTQINIPGVHNVHNALAACVVVTAMGLPLDVVAKGLANFVPAKGRLQTHRLSHDCILIDDTYNANPDSVLAAIEVLANTAGRKILVLGDMGEVGDDGEAFHGEIGAHAKARGIDVLLATGAMMRQAAQAFGAGAQYFEDAAGIAEVVRAHMGNTASTVLVKGSRFMKMEQVVNALLDAHHSTQVPNTQNTQNTQN